MKTGHGIIAMKTNIIIVSLIAFSLTVLSLNAYAWKGRVEWLREINGIEKEE